MARIICRNTFLDFSPSGEESASEHAPQSGQRPMSAGPRLRFAERTSDEVTESQLERLNLLLELDSASPLPFLRDVSAVTTKPKKEGDVTNVSELIQLQTRLQQALAPKQGGAASDKMTKSLSLSKLAKADSNTSISTMAPDSDDEAEDVDQWETDDDFEANVDRYVATTSTPHAPRPLPTQMFVSPQVDATNSSGLLPVQLRYSSKVPRNANLAEEYQRSGDAGAPPTTIMIRNIPNRYTQREFLMELEDLGFAGSFDFVYVPMDKCTRSNLGYSFVNFIAPTWAAACLQQFQNYRFMKYRNVSSKIAVASVAHLQGLENNIAHYENKAVNASKHKQHRPIVFGKISNVLVEEQR